MACLGWVGKSTANQHFLRSALHNPKIGATNQQKQNHHLRLRAALATGGLKCIYWYQNFVLDYVVVKAPKQC